MSESAARLRLMGDRIAGRALGLPAPSTGYTVTRGLRVPMRDRVELLADHYAPNPAPRPAGTLLLRGPYGRGFPSSLVFARFYAARGFHVIVQSVRGTFGSGGVFEPMVNEVADGADTVAWLRRQPWFTGRFATIGLSYLGFTQWALLHDPPPELAAAVVIAGPHDFSLTSWGTGAFALNDFLGWSDWMAHQEDGGRVRLLIRVLGARRRLARATAGLPLGAAGRALLGARAPWYESWIEHPDPGDPFWEPLRFTDALDRVRAPVLLLSGWQDLFLEQTLRQYRQLRERGVGVALTVGPWTHAEMLTKGLSRVTRESFEWLDAHLAGGHPPRRSPVRIRVTGGGDWLDLPDWPPAATGQALYPRCDGTLLATPPAADAQSSSFRYDPADPTPTIGGRLLALEAGPRDDTRLARRHDVLSFTSAPLPADLCVAGTPAVDLRHSCDNPHADLFVRISEVDTGGRSRNVSDGYLRLPPRTRPASVRIELDTVAHRFRAGSRIRLLIAGGSHPRYARNLGTGEPAATGRRLVGATHTVHHGATSQLVLPVR